jgi:hypothetical protein
MDLTLRRWVALALAGVVAVAAAVFGIAGPSATFHEESLPAARQQVRELRTALREAETTLALLEQREWAREELRKRRDDGPPGLIVLADPAFEPSELRSVTALADSAWERLPMRDSSIGLILALVTDRSGSRSGDEPRLSGPRRGRTFFAPTLFGESACLATIMVPMQGLVSPFRATDSRSARGPRPRLAVLRDDRLMGLFGLCGWYAAFGNPGPAIQTWLFRTRHRMAANGPWMQRQDPDTERQIARAVPWRRMVNLGTPLAALRYGFDAVACAGDRPSRCAAAVLSPAPDTTGIPVTGTPGLSRMPAQSGAFRDVAGSWLADLLLEMGPDRFRRFWKSPHQVDVAFAETFGVPLGEWTVGWARGRIGEPKLGPAPELGEIVTAAGWLVLAFAMVAWGRARRQVR